jgi:hypothetical protein
MENELGFENVSSDKIKKHVATLAMVPQSGAISRVGRQAYTVMMMHARKQIEKDPDCTLFRVPLRSVLRGFEGSESSSSQAELKRHLRSMVTHIIEWQSPTAGEVDSVQWSVCGLLASVGISKCAAGDNWLEWEYASRIKSEILNPSRYAQLQISSVSQFRSHSGLALYEICARYKDNIGHLTAKQDWQWWIPVLTGKPPPKVIKTQYRFFKRDTIKPAIDEVNAVSELTVTLKEIKVGRTVSHLQFEVRCKSEATPNGNQLVDIAKISKAIDLGISPEDAEALYLKHGDEKFSLVTNVFASRLARPGAKPIESRLAYFKSMFDDPLVGQQTTAARAEDASEKPVPKQPSVAAINLEAAAALGAAKLEGVKQEILALPAVEQEALLEEVKAKLQADGRHLGAVAMRNLAERKWDTGMLLGEVARFYWQKTRGTDWSFASAAVQSPEIAEVESA